MCFNLKDGDQNYMLNSPFKVFLKLNVTQLDHMNKINLCLSAHVLRFFFLAKRYEGQASHFGMGMHMICYY